MKTAFYLSWYSAETEEELGVEELAITEDQVREWFWVSEGDTILGGHIVTASHRKHLQKYTSHPIDLNSYDYYVELLRDK